MHPHGPRARTVALVRLLSSIGLQRPRRGGRLPRQVQPDGIRLEYHKAILAAVVDPVVRAVEAGFLPELLRLVEEDRRAKGLTIDASPSGRAKDLLARAAASTGRLVDWSRVYAKAEEFGRRTERHQAEQLDRQVRQAVGVPLSAIERPTRDRIEEFAALNVDLIRTVPERYLDRVRLEVERAFAEGATPGTLAKRFEEIGAAAGDDARRIARDQVGKLNAQVNQDRQEALGVTGYVWRTVGDARVRPEHGYREGDRFEWSSPPSDGHPGEPVCCRCSADPDLSPLLGDA